MISKIISSLLIGFLLTFSVNFMFFLGVKLNYYDFYNIPMNFNRLFFENINIWLYFILSSVLGGLFVFPKQLNMGFFAYITFLFLASLTLLPSIGRELGFFLD
jgi:hypothetical protein